AGATFEEQPEYELPLNAYAYSKLLFDQYVRKQRSTEFQCVGLRYFNVYGDREQHKGRMASVAYHFFHQYRKHGKVRLFEASAGYANGEQRRDFVSVEDVVKVNLYLLEHPQVSGIFNVGTGRSQSFNEVALAVVNSLRQESGQGLLTVEAAQEAGAIEYIPMPEALAGKYQSFTEANIEALRGVGYEAPFFSVEEGVARYIDRLREKAESA
ncbi:MAG: NAD-dependent epimerase/dehydratase family protein, partial [Pseudomonadota bacterium]|nr:NAD-dependent epimerase/dehydratase family protein [Pseudomonadota bacterium]